jgi:hypothetical protein
LNKTLKVLHTKKIIVFVAIKVYELHEILPPLNGIIDKGGIKNYQTEADRAVERLIISSLKSEFPNLTVIGEEGEEFDHAKETPITRQCLEVLGKTFPTEADSIKERIDI